VVAKMCNNCRKCILCLSCVRKNLIRFDQCPECSIAQPDYIELPRNYQCFYNQIQVQCHKCIDKFIYSKWKLAISEPNHIQSHKILSQPMQKVELSDQDINSIKSESVVNNLDDEEGCDI
jgi:hypothetical protein